jgi:hypothetical protein
MTFINTCQESWSTKMTWKGALLVQITACLLQGLGQPDFHLLPESRVLVPAHTYQHKVPDACLA